MAFTSTTCGDHLARKSWREAVWDAVILHMVHKSLRPQGVVSQGAQNNLLASYSGECDLVVITEAVILILSVHFIRTFKLINNKISMCDIFVLLPVVLSVTPDCFGVRCEECYRP